MGSWDRLIQAAEARMPELVELLRRLCDVGCELERQPSGKWRIRYGKAITAGRVTEAEIRDQWLRPNADKLRVALAWLEEPEPAHKVTEPTPATQESAPTETVQPERLDPRPDLQEDSGLWEAILAEARRRNRTIGHYQDVDGITRPVRLEELFHALRCFGVTATTQQGPTGPRLKLIWEHVCAPEQDEDGRWLTWMRPEQFRRMYLEPYRNAIADHLKHTWEVLHHAQPVQPAQAAAA